MSRSQPSTSATKSSSTVVPASPATSRAALIRAASVPPSEAKDHPILPPAKVKKGPTCHREKLHQPPSKASSKTKEDSAKVPAATSKVGKGHKAKGKSAKGTEPPGEGLVSPVLQDRTATCTAVTTATCTATFTSAASATVSSIILSGSHPRLQETSCCLPPQVLTPAPPAASPPQAPPQTPPPAPRRAQPVPPQPTSASTPVGSHPRLQETS
ncbi:hypothetical protein NDU88_004281 [Pleurodeles waltl]|uniref:Uncharacterized protein n=1 Tax=Pleurodeles waltl TaxID=8319 RepID=A0AAV7TTR1_PLEWA|nr:hypothetical protein NDU88_004281 [Pleurodeles waltl]